MKKILLLFSSFLTTTILTNNVVSCSLFHKNKPKHNSYKDMTTVPGDYPFEVDKNYEFKVDGEKCKFENGSTTESKVTYKIDSKGHYFAFPSDNKISFNDKNIYWFLVWHDKSSGGVWQLDNLSDSSGVDISEGEIWISLPTTS